MWARGFWRQSVRISHSVTPKDHTEPFMLKSSYKRFPRDACSISFTLCGFNGISLRKWSIPKATNVKVLGPWKFHSSPLYTAHRPWPSHKSWLIPRSPPNSFYEEPSNTKCKQIRKFIFLIGRVVGLKEGLQTFWEHVHFIFLDSWCWALITWPQDPDGSVKDSPSSSSRTQFGIPRSPTNSSWKINNFEPSSHIQCFYKGREKQGPKAQSINSKGDSSVHLSNFCQVHQELEAFTPNWDYPSARIHLRSQRPRVDENNLKGISCCCPTWAYWWGGIERSTSPQTQGRGRVRASDWTVLAWSRWDPGHVRGPGYLPTVFPPYSTQRRHKEHMGFRD